MVRHLARVVGVGVVCICKLPDRIPDLPPCRRAIVIATRSPAVVKFSLSPAVAMFSLF